MKNSSFLRVAVPLLVLTVGAIRAEAAAAADVNLTGTFSWTGHKASEPMDVVLTPSGTNQWNAAFTFTWDKKPHTWNGVLSGHLDNGDFSGEVKSDGGGRTFQVKGRASNHVLSFTHSETTGGKNTSTGSGTLKTAAAAKPMNQKA